MNSDEIGRVCQENPGVPVHVLADVEPVLKSEFEEGWLLESTWKAEATRVAWLDECLICEDQDYEDFVDSIYDGEDTEDSKSAWDSLEWETCILIWSGDEPRYEDD